MHNLIDYMDRFLTWLCRKLLSLRYDIKTEGLDGLKNKKGILFLANHPALIDPVILLAYLWHPFRIHPMAMESLFFTPYVRRLMEKMGAVPVPSFDDNTNSYKKKAIQHAFDSIIAGLKEGENYLIYPAGGLKKQAEEQIGGTSGVHTLVSAHGQPRMPIVLVKTRGLWGSSFSKAPTGLTPPLGATFKKGLLILLKNGLFFSPRRRIVIEFTEACDFPYDASRAEVNRYLEEWYNRDLEPIYFVPYSLFSKTKMRGGWKKKATEKKDKQDPAKEEAVRPRIRSKLATLSRREERSIEDTMGLAQDLGLDSLDMAELTLFLKEEFGVSGVTSAELVIVYDVIAYAAGLKRPKVSIEETIFRDKKLEQRPCPQMPKGRTLPEAFLHSAKRMASNLASIDQATGPLSYRTVLLRALLLSWKLKRLCGQYVGVMLPASSTNNIVVLALLFAKKIPVMINWTLGARNLEAIVQETGIDTTITSYNFINRLAHVDLGVLDDTLLFLEKIALDLTWTEKIMALLLTYLPEKMLSNILKIGNLDDQSPAVLLYTSGTEGIPKGVPLSHYNLLSNLRDGFSLLCFYKEDFLVSALPPFHSFGFSVTGLFPLCAAIRVGYVPNPTDGRRMASAIEAWQGTIICSAPSFLKNLVRQANPPQCRSLRLIISGAEKLSEDLDKSLHQLNSEILIIEGYGITECAPILTLVSIDMPSIAGVGRPLASVEMIIVDPESYSRRGPHQEGMILVRGPNIFSGYFNPALASPFVDVEGKKWYKTGDMGFLDDKGILHLTGRFKRFIKIGGEMISLGAMEEVLALKAPSKEEVQLAIVAQEEETGPRIVLFATFDITVQEANRFLKEAGFSNLYRLTEMRRIPAIPLLATGKIHYRELLQQL